MKEKVRVAAIQMDVKGMDMEANLCHILETIEQVAASDSVDLVVLPELANSGYVKGGDLAFSKEYVLKAEKIPGKFTKRLGEAARKHGIYVVTGMLQAHPDIPYTIYNSAVLIGPTGEVVGVHNKMHLPFEERHFFYPGSTSNVFATQLGNIAIQVCADAFFPELCRIFALKGAEIMCTCYNSPLIEGKEFVKERILHQSVCRAQENALFFIGCNRVGSDAGNSFFGRSCIAGPSGEVLAYSECDREEILRATLEEETLREARVFSPYFRDRKPELYGLITKPF